MPGGPNRLAQLTLRARPPGVFKQRQHNLDVVNVVGLCNLNNGLFENMSRTLGVPEDFRQELQLVLRLDFQHRLRAPGRQPRNPRAAASWERSTREARLSPVDTSVVPVPQPTPRQSGSDGPPKGLSPGLVASVVFSSFNRLRSRASIAGAESCRPKATAARTISTATLWSCSATPRRMPEAISALAARHWATAFAAWRRTAADLSPRAAARTRTRSAPARGDCPSK